MATQKVFCKYQEIIDLNTVGGTVSVIGIHTPTGDTPRKMFPGFFQQYKKWKYLGCSVVGANAAQLPVDPLGVSYEAGEGNDTVADPRDVLNPILFHGCHGQDLGPILNSLYCQNSTNDLTDSLTGFNEDSSADSDAGRSELVEGLYYKALTDATWKKFGIQSGIRLNRLHPLVYSMATNHYISPSDLGGALAIDASGNVVADGKVPDVDGLLAVGSRDTRFFTPRLTGLGWMETRLPYVAAANLPSQISDDEYSDWQAQLQSVKNYATMPKIFMGVLLLPPSYRIKQFMRLVITHRFAFAGFRGASFADNVLGSPSFFEAPDMDFSDGSNDDDILGGNPNDDGSGTDPDDPTPPLGGGISLSDRYAQGTIFLTIDGVTKTIDQYATLDDGQSHTITNVVWNNTTYQSARFAVYQEDGDSAVDSPIGIVASQPDPSNSSNTLVAIIGGHFFRYTGGAWSEYADGYDDYVVTYSSTPSVENEIGTATVIEGISYEL